MARIKKFAPEQNLTSFQTLVVDENPNSDYFRITEFKDTFTGGKNGFLIEGSEYLKESTEIKIEILDVEGNPIYYEPGNGIPEYYEGISKLVAVYVYNDTPIGLGKITILGELKEYDDNGVKRTIPSEWQGAYNVKWERTFQVNKNLSNEDKVRFYRRPEVTIDEIVKPIFSGNPPSVTQTGSVDGIPLVPTQNSNLSNFTLPTSYRLKVNSGNKWTGSIEGQTISFDNIIYSPTIDEVVNETEIIVSPPYSVNDLVQPFTNEDYTLTFPYIEGVGDLATALTGSFAKINITDMKTFVGDAARVKVFRRSQSNLTDFEFVQEIQLESNEVLRDITTFAKKEEPYGFFTQQVIDDYWVTSSNDFNVEFNQNVLYNSVKLDSSPTNFFFTSESFSIQNGVEYTLDFNVRKDSNTSGDYLKVFLSGSNNGSGVSQTITTIDSSNTILQKTNFSENIIADTFDSAKLYIEVSGSDWYVNNVSLKASQETSFSPDEITFIQQVPKTLVEETFDYRFEFYDINNNFIPVRVEETKTFTGGNTNLFNKSIEITPDNLYFSFDSASNPANAVPPLVINFDVETNLVTGSITYTSGAFDFFGNEISASEYVGGQYPGYLTDWDVDSGRQPFLRVQDFTGSRDDIIVQFIRYTAAVEGVSDTFIITRVEDGKGGVSFEIVPFRGTQIKNKESKTLEVQAVRVDGINRIDLQSGLDRGFSDAKLHLLSSSLDGTQTYVSLSQAITDTNFVEGISAGLTGSGEIDYNAIFTRDAIDNELTLYLMDGPTSESILTSLILTDLKDGLNPGLVQSTTEQFNIKYKPRELSPFNPQQSIVTASFQRRGTTLNPLSASLVIYPSSSIQPKTELPEFFMFYETGAFDDTITLNVTDGLGNSIGSGIPGDSVTYYDADETKQLNLEFTYTEPITSASVTANKSFFITPDGLPGQDSIDIDIDPQPVALGSNHKGDVYNYGLANTDIQLRQGDLFLINTSSNDPGTFTTRSIVPTNIEFTSLVGNSTTTMSLSGFESMSALSASIRYDFDIYPYFTSSLITASRTQKFTKVVEGAGAIEVTLDPIAVSFNADESGFISNYSAAETEIIVKQNDEYLVYDSSNSGTPGTFVTASVSASNITFTEISSSNLDSEVSGDEILHFKGFGGMARTDVSASVVYNLITYPYALKAGVAGVPVRVSKKQTFSKVNDGSAARKVSLKATSDTIIYDGDGTKISPSGDVQLIATAVNNTGSAYFKFLNEDGGTIGASSTNDTLTLGDLPSTGSTETFTVELRDGNPNGLVLDTDSVTIVGIQEGSTAYSAQLSNPASSVTVEVDGTTFFDNSGTLIRAYKGGTELQFVEEYDEEALDPITFLPIGTFGQFSASIYEISSFLTHENGVIEETSGELYGSSSGVSNWDTPQSNTQGYIIYKIDFENGRGEQFIQQSFSTVFEGATGPGLVFRGPYTGSIDYIFNLQQKRRDAVLYSEDGNEPYDTYYATKESGSTYTIPSGTQPPTVGGVLNSDYWESLGQEEFFVAAKLAIFEQSFVKETINVGTPPDGNPNANIAIVGGTDEPYIAIGQTGTQGYAQPGVFLGLTNDGGPAGTSGTTGLLSLKSVPVGGQYNSLEWDGETLTIRGAIRQTAAGIIEGSQRGLWSSGVEYYPNDIVSANGQSWVMIGAVHTSTTNDEPGVGVNYTTYWEVAAASGTSGTAGSGGSSGVNAKTIRLSANHQAFVVANDGSISPSTITLTANRQNISTATTFTPTPSVTLGGSGDTRTLSSTDFGANTAVTIEASADGLSDEITIVRVEEGSDAITIVLSNESHTFQADSAGTISSYGGSGTTITLYEGATQLDYDGSGATAGHWTVSASPTNITTGTISDGGNFASVDEHENMTANQASIVYTITGKKLNGDSFSFTKTQSFSKSVAGENGTSGTSGASGSPGSPGAGIVYRGEYDGTKAYIHTTERRDVVLYNSSYYLVNNLSKSGNTNWGVPPTDWESFGAQFESVATDILFSKDVFAEQTINVGASGSSAVIALNADAANSNTNPYISIGQGGTQGYGNDGIFLGFDSATPKFSLLGDGGFVNFDGTDFSYSGLVTGSAVQGGELLIGFDTTSMEYQFRVNPQGEVTALGDNNTFSGTITANNGILGGWSINSAGISDISGSILLSSEDLEFSVSDLSGSQRFNVNTGLDLPSTTGGSIISASLSGLGSISDDIGRGDTTTGQSTATDYLVSPVLSVSSAGKYKLKAPHVGNGLAYAEGVGFGSWATLNLKVELRRGTGANVGGGGTLHATTTTISTTSTGYDSEIGGGGFSSVIKGTKISLPNGKTKNVEDLRIGDDILAWNIETSQYETARLRKIKSRTVNVIYRVTIGDKVLDVSDTHGFFYAPGWQIRIQNLREGEDEVYVKEGDTFVKRMVDSIEILNEEIQVYSLSVPVLKNYISNDIISHNFGESVPESGGINQLQSAVLSKTFEVSTGETGNYYAHYVVDYSLNTFEADTEYYSQIKYQIFITGTAYVTIEPQSTGTFVNGGGFAVVNDDNNYFRVSSDDSKQYGYDIGYATDLKGGLAIDALYGAGGNSPIGDVGGAYNVAGHPYIIKGTGIVTFTTSATGTHGSGTIRMSAGNFDSMSGTTQGIYVINYTSELATGTAPQNKYATVIASARRSAGGSGIGNVAPLGVTTAITNNSDGTGTTTIYVGKPNASILENIQNLQFIIIQ